MRHSEVLPPCWGRTSTITAPVLCSKAPKTQMRFWSCWPQWCFLANVSSTETDSSAAPSIRLDDNRAFEQMLRAKLHQSMTVFLDISQSLEIWLTAVRLLHRYKNNRSLRRGNRDRAKKEPSHIEVVVLQDWIGQRHLTPSITAIDEGSNLISTPQNLHFLVEARSAFDLKKACSFKLSIKIRELMKPTRPIDGFSDILNKSNQAHSSMWNAGTNYRAFWLHVFYISIPAKRVWGD